MLEKLQSIFRDLLDDENLVITLETSRNDIDEWDSLFTINLIVSIAEEFDRKISNEEMEKFTSVENIIDVLSK